MTTRINGGILTDQMMTGGVRYFKMTAALTTSNGDDPFTYTISDGTVAIPGQHIIGWDQSLSVETIDVVANININNLFIGDGQPVVGSVADRAFRVVMEKCTINLAPSSGT